MCKITIFLIFLWLLLGCENGTNPNLNDLSNDDSLNENHIPIAVISGKDLVTTGSIVELEASNSFDSDNDFLTFYWKLESIPINSSTFLSNISSEKITFSPDMDGNYEISLIVNDGESDSMPSTLLVTSGPDMFGPDVSSITVDPTTVDVSTANQVVTASVMVTDDTGVDLDSLPVPYWYQSSDIQGTRINSPWVLVSGDSLSATFESTVTLTPSSKPGSWTVGCISFKDTLGYSSTNGGYSASFTVEN